MAHLPVLKSDSRSSVDLLRGFDQAMVSYVEEVTLPKAMDWGQAFLDRSFPQAWEANCILQADLPTGVSAEIVVHQMQDHFLGAGARLPYIGINPSVPATSRQSLEKALAEKGYVSATRQVMRLNKGIDPPAESVSLQIIPARASYRHVQEIAEQQADPFIDPQAMINHLDDPRLDALLIMRENQIVAYGDILSMGQTGVIQKLLVSRTSPQPGIESLLLGQLVEIGRRSQFLHILAGPWTADQQAVNLLQTVGFELVGQWVIWIPGK